jgi:hypothetical protein
MAVTANPLITRLIFLSLLAGCGAVSSAPTGQVPPEIVDVPNEIVVGNTTLRLTVYPWRDFQPSSAPDTRLMTQFQITAGSGTVPSGLRAEKAWLVRENEAWPTTLRQEAPPSSATRVEYMSRGGPTWPVGTLVVGVLQLRDAANKSYLVRSSPHGIERAD